MERHREWPGNEIGTFLASSDLKRRDQKGVPRGVHMITMAIGLVAGIFYWIAWYKLAFWILVYAIIYGGLGVLRGGNQAHALLRRDSALTIAILIPLAWHIGGLAGYW
jgi:hypothetical protein